MHGEGGEHPEQESSSTGGKAQMMMHQCCVCMCVCVCVCVCVCERERERERERESFSAQTTCKCPPLVLRTFTCMHVQWCPICHTPCTTGFPCRERENTGQLTAAQTAHPAA